MAGLARNPGRRLRTALSRLARPSLLAPAVLNAEDLLRTKAPRGTRTAGQNECRAPRELFPAYRPAHRRPPSSSAEWTGLRHGEVFASRSSLLVRHGITSDERPPKRLRSGSVAPLTPLGLDGGDPLRHDSVERTRCGRGTRAPTAHQRARGADGAPQVCERCSCSVGDEREQGPCGCLGAGSKCRRSLGGDDDRGDVVCGTIVAATTGAPVTLASDSFPVRSTKRSRCALERVADLAARRRWRQQAVSVGDLTDL